MKRAILAASLAVWFSSTAAEGQSTQSRQPRTSFDGPALQFDFPGLRIGVAEYDEGPTGATVFQFGKPVMAAVDVRGGAPGTINTDALRLAYDDPFVSAVTFAGGSAYGLAAATGAADQIKAGTPDSTAFGHIVTVVGAIIFDVGNRRFSTVTPDYELGRAAVRAAQPGRFLLGARGAGRFATTGRFFEGVAERQYSGQGAAFAQFGPTKLLVFTVVNSLGTIVDRRGQVVRCATGKGSPSAGCGLAADLIASFVKSIRTRVEPAATAGATPNTTITLVVTNQKLPFWALQRLATQVQSSMARAIQPFATASDGDTLFAVSTGEVENKELSPANLAFLASEVAWDAVLASVPQLPPVGPTTAVALPGNELDAYVGDYEFGGGVRGVVRREAAGLTMEILKTESLYFPRGKPTALTAVSGNEFLVQTGRADRVRFERSANGAVTGLVINPGPWPIPAKRLR